MTKRAVTALAASLLMTQVAGAPAQAQTLGDQISQLFAGADAGCDTNVSNALTKAIRNGIDSEVKRAEAALKTPSPISQMGCLDSLLNINLNTLVQVPNVSQMMQGAINAGKQKLCGFARQQMRKATEPLTAALKLPSFQNLGIPGFTPQSTTIEFEEPQLGFGSEGKVILNPRQEPDTRSLEERYNSIGGETE